MKKLVRNVVSLIALSPRLLGKEVWIFREYGGFCPPLPQLNRFKLRIVIQLFWVNLIPYCYNHSLEMNIVKSSNKLGSWDAAVDQIFHRQRSVGGSTGPWWWLVGVREHWVRVRNNKYPASGMMRVGRPGIVRGDTGHSLLKLMWCLLRPGSLSADTSTPGNFDFEFYQNKLSLTHGALLMKRELNAVFLINPLRELYGKLPGV